MPVKRTKHRLFLQSQRTPVTDPKLGTRCLKPCTHTHTHTHTHPAFITTPPALHLGELHALFIFIAALQKCPRVPSRRHNTQPCTCLTWPFRGSHLWPPSGARALSLSQSPWNGLCDELVKSLNTFTSSLAPDKGTSVGPQPCRLLHDLSRPARKADQLPR